MPRVEREEKDPLPLPEAERPIENRHLLRTRAEEEREQLLAAALARRHDALEQRLEILEEDARPSSTMTMRSSSARRQGRS